MLKEPRLLLLRALGPLYPRVPPPKASRFPPPLRDKSRLPMRSAPPADLPPKFEAARSLTPAPAPRLPRLPVEGRLAPKLPPSRAICWRALACRLARESPRVVPPKRLAVAWSR